MTFCFPSTLVLSRRRMNWKEDFSPETRDMMGDFLGGVVVDRVRCRCRWQPDKSSEAASNFAGNCVPLVRLASSEVTWRSCQADRLALTPKSGSRLSSATTLYRIGKLLVFLYNISRLVMSLLFLFQTFSHTIGAFWAISFPHAMVSFNQSATAASPSPSSGRQ